MSESKSKFLDVNGALSYVQTWGCWVEDETPNEVIIFITGNPGRLGFYVPYLQRLHDVTKIPVWTISHVGHEEPASEVSNFKNASNRGCFNKLSGKYDLEPQLQQKIDFILNYTKTDTNIHLIGHSIGAWMVMQALKNSEVRSRVHTKLLVFPTIQKMAESPNGLFLNGTVRSYYHQILLIARLFFYLPLFIRNFCVTLFLVLQFIPMHFKEATLGTTIPMIVEKVLFLAFDEMDKVRELDIQTLLLIKENLFIIYNDNDGWAPKEYFDEIRNYDLNIPLKSVPYSHSFPLKSSIEFANLTAEYFVKNSTNI